jgi:hypothetical protein
MFGVWTLDFSFDLLCDWIECNILVVMIDYMIIIATPSLKTKWGNLMVGTKEGQALMDKSSYMHFVAKWWKVEVDKLMEEEIALSKSMWYVSCFLHESSSYLKLVKILKKQKKTIHSFFCCKIFHLLARMFCHFFLLNFAICFKICIGC